MCLTSLIKTATDKSTLYVHACACLRCVRVLVLICVVFLLFLQTEMENGVLTALAPSRLRFGLSTLALAVIILLFFTIFWVWWRTFKADKLQITAKQRSANSKEGGLSDDPLDADEMEAHPTRSGPSEEHALLDADDNDLQLDDDVLEAQDAGLDDDQERYEAKHS